MGTLEATTRRMAQAVTPQVENLKQWVNKQPHVHVDESPWLVRGVKEWIWVLSGKGYSLFHAGDTRSRAELESLLGHSFTGVLSSDVTSVYNGYRVSAQQKCLAHLQRHFWQVSKLKSPHQAELGQAFLDLIDEAFTQHRQWRETGEASVSANWASSFKKRIARSLDTWRSKAGHAASLLLRSLENKCHQWWYFLDHPEVPPDNNLAERTGKRTSRSGKRTGRSPTATLATNACWMRPTGMCDGRGRRP